MTTQTILAAARALIADPATYNGSFYFHDIGGNRTNNVDLATVFSIAGAVFKTCGASWPHDAGYDLASTILDFVAVGLPATPTTLQTALEALSGKLTSAGREMDGATAVIRWEYHDKPSHADALKLIDAAIASGVETAKEYADQAFGDLVSI